MADTPGSLVLEHLRAIRTKLDKIEATLSDHTQQFLSVRQQIHALDGNFLRLEAVVTRLDPRIERIERRPDFVEA